MDNKRTQLGNIIPPQRPAAYYDQLSEVKKTLIDEKIENFLQSPPFVDNIATIKRVKTSLSLVNGVIKGTPVFTTKNFPNLTCWENKPLTELIEIAFGVGKDNSNPQLMRGLKSYFESVTNSLNYLAAVNGYITLQTNPVARLKRSKAECIGLLNHFKGRLYLNEVDSKGNQWRIAVKMGPVTFRSRRFGTFMVGLQVPLAASTEDAVISVIPDNPLWAAATEAVAEKSLCHPHVKNNVLCLGDVHTRVWNHFINGRYMDAMILIELLIMNYSTDGAYKHLSQWKKGYPTRQCYKCKKVMVIRHLLQCNECHIFACRDCGKENQCDMCKDYQCEMHIHTCMLCGSRTCLYCFQRRQGDRYHKPRLVCPTCWGTLDIATRDLVCFDGEVSNLNLLKVIAGNNLEKRDKCNNLINKLNHMIGNVNKQGNQGSGLFR